MRSPLLFLTGSELDTVVWHDGLYELLDVPRHATHEEIRRAYRQKAKQMHPDIHGGCRHEAMVRLNKAREVLSSETLRPAYDWLR